MDVYHKVLHKLYEVTGGKDSKAVDFKDLIKQLGFFGNYKDITKFLSGEGWIVESSKADYVSITHWGAAEVKKTVDGGGGGASDEEIKRESKRAVYASQELSELLEAFTENPSKDNFPKVEKKFTELQTLFTKIRNL